MTALWIFSPHYGICVKLWHEEEKKNHQRLLLTHNDLTFWYVSFQSFFSGFICFSIQKETICYISSFISLLFFFLQSIISQAFSYKWMFCETWFLMFHIIALYVWTTTYLTIPPFKIFGLLLICHFLNNCRYGTGCMFWKWTCSPLESFFPFSIENLTCQVFNFFFMFIYLLLRERETEH